MSIKRGGGFALGKYTSEDFNREEFPEGWITVMESTPGVFHVKTRGTATVDLGGDFMSPEDIGFASWDDEVRDLDNEESDVVRYCNIGSTHLEWNDVTFRIEVGPYGAETRVTAPTLDRLKEALSHVSFKLFDSKDI